MTEAPKQQQFVREVTRQLYFNNAGAIITGCLLAILIALMLYGIHTGMLLYAWMALLLSTYLGRYLLTHIYFRTNDREPRAWLFRFRASIALQGALWGIAVPLFYPHDHTLIQVAFLFTISGLAAGGAIAFGIDLVSVFLFELPLALPLIAYLLADWTFESVLMSMMVMAFLGYLSTNLVRSSHTMRENISLRLDAALREEMMRNQNTLLNTILESEPECVKVVAPNGQVEQMNPAGLAMLEATSIEELNQAGLMRLVHHDDRPAFLALFKRVCAGESGQLEFRVKGLHGSLRWLETNATPLRNVHGEIAGMLGVTRDVTGRKQHELALRVSEEKLRGLYELAPLGIALTGMDGRYMEFNEAFRTISGYDEAELKRLDSWTLTPARYREDEARQLESLRQTGRYGPYEKECLRKDGTLVPLRLNGMLVTGRDGKQYIWSIVEDISASRQAEREVRIAATAFESREGMLITDEQANILRVNKAFTEITGYSSEEVVGKNPHLLNSGHHDRRFFESMWESIAATGNWMGEVWNRRKNGDVFPEHLSITSVKDENGKVLNYVGSFTDITQRKETEEEIQRLAFYDHLTLLPNRRLFMDRLRQALAAAGRNRRNGALLFIDLDNFKNLNDTLGHDYGDMLLHQIAERLKQCVREGDTVARLGGDEFVVLLEDLDGRLEHAVPQVEAAGKKIQELLGQPYDLQGTRYSSTPSIGVTLLGDQQIGAEDFLKQADIAMYQAKKSGRNTLRFFDQHMQEAISRRATLEADLRGALERKQLQLYFQVQKTGQGRAVGAEALLRWLHPERGVVAPAEFIPLAEETGAIIAIGQHVLDMACAQLKKWEQHPVARSFSLAVNVSARQFHQPEFAAQIESTIGRHGINPGRLKLELTESVVLQDIEDTVQIMNALNSIGAQISLDDFGTGYSSLQYLRRLPLDQLKIDQSFVRDIAQNGGDLAIVQTIIAMADSLGLDIIAEGVETEKQRQLLQKSGCTHFQGYLFGKPLPIEAFEASLKS